jgi:hypothetical protein
VVVVNCEKRRGKVSLTVLSEEFGKRGSVSFGEVQARFDRDWKISSIVGHYLSNLALLCVQGPAFLFKGRYAKNNDVTSPR